MTKKKKKKIATPTLKLTSDKLTIWFNLLHLKKWRYNL